MYTPEVSPGAPSWGDDTGAVPSSAARLPRHDILRRVGDHPLVQHAAVFLFFCLLSLALFGPKVLHGFDTRFIARLPMDASIFMWSLRWWPYAIGHHLNPLFTRLDWAPGGMNLAWTTTPPVPSLLLAPITLWFGPVAAYNVMTLLGPALSAWAAYLLCRRITHAPMASVVGGLAFGFSVAVLYQLEQGHPNFFLAPMVPLAAYWVVRYLEGSLSPTALVVLFGGTILVQFGISTEVTATMTYFAGVALVFGLVFAGRAWRVRLARTAGLMAIAYAGVLVLTIPWLYVAFRDPRPVFTLGGTVALTHPWTMLSEAVLPGNTIVAGIHPLEASNFGADLYIGLPLLFVLLHLVVTQWRNPAVRALAVTFVFAFASAFGEGMVIGGHTFPTPFRLLLALPFLHLALPGRLLTYCALIAAVGIALWLALAPRGWWRWALALVAVVSTLPNPGITRVVATVPSAPILSAAADRTDLPPDARVLIDQPMNGWKARVRLGDSMLWQAEDGMSYALAGGWFGTATPPNPDVQIIRSLDMNTSFADDRAAITALVRRAGVTSILVLDQSPVAVRRLCRVLATPPVTVDRVAVFRGPFTVGPGRSPPVRCLLHPA